MRAIVLALGMLATPALAADQFDLVCTAKKEQVRYRVDLAKGEWCQGDCSTLQKIVDHSSGEIVLERHERAFRNDRETRIAINRTSGDWTTFEFDPTLDRVPLSREGTCIPGAFSGFPATKF